MFEILDLMLILFIAMIFMKNIILVLVIFNIIDKEIKNIEFFQKGESINESRI